MFHRLSLSRKERLALVFLGIFALLAACTGPAREDPEKTFHGVIEEVAQSTPLYFKLEPMGVPDKALDAANRGNEAAQLLVGWIRILNESLQIRRSPSLPSSMTFPLKSVDVASYDLLQSSLSPMRTKGCVSWPYPTCTFTWYENNGALKVTALQLLLSDICYLGIFYDGEAGGYSYKGEPIQVWITGNDLKWSNFTYFSKMPSCASTTLPLWFNYRWVEDEGKLCIGGEGCWLLYKTHWISETYACTLGEYHHVWRLESISYPLISSISSVWRNYLWSLSKKQLYLWVELVYHRDYYYCMKVFDEDQRVIKQECGYW